MSERPNPLLKFIDLDGAIMSSETPSLKAIFDNLRNYPILALFYLVARDITHLPFPVATAFHYALVLSPHNKFDGIDTIKTVL